MPHEYRGAQDPGVLRLLQMPDLEAGNAETPVERATHIARSAGLRRMRRSTSGVRSYHVGLTMRVAPGATQAQTVQVRS